MFPLTSFSSTDVLLFSFLLTPIRQSAFVFRFVNLALRQSRFFQIALCWQMALARRSPSATSALELASAAKKSCEDTNLQDAASLLNIHVHGHFSQDQLAVALDSSREAVGKLFQSLKLGNSEAISLKEFCEAAVHSSPSMLSETLPPPNVACLDSGCKETVDISIDELFKIPLIPPPEQGDLVTDDDVQIFETPVHHGERDLLREALQRLFHIYPAPKSETVDSATSALQLRPDPSFHKTDYSVSSEVQQMFGKSVQMATRWVVETMDLLKTDARNSPAMNQLFLQWFKSDDQEVKKAVFQHLSNIYWVLISLYVVPETGHAGSCSTNGNMAYVTNKCQGQNLPFLSNSPCGESYSTSESTLYVVHMCPVSWESQWMFHVGNIVHEASHHYGTKDLAYGMKGCLGLGMKQAVSNADQYIYFIQHVMAKHYPDKTMRSYRGGGQGDGQIDLKAFTQR